MMSVENTIALITSAVAPTMGLVQAGVDSFQMPHVVFYDDDGSLNDKTELYRPERNQVGGYVQQIHAYERHDKDTE